MTSSEPTATNAEKKGAPDFPKSFACCHLSGTLSTVTEGAPSGSYAVYDIVEEGDLLFSFANIAEHTKQLLAVPQASFVITATGRWSGALERPRLTLSGRCLPVPMGEGSHLLDRFLRRFPDHPCTYVPGFQLFKLTPERVRWIGGFGEARWIAADRWKEWKLDGVAWASAAPLELLNGTRTAQIMHAAAARLSAASGTKLVDCFAFAVDSTGLRLCARLLSGERVEERKVIHISFHARAREELHRLCTDNRREASAHADESSMQRRAAPPRPLPGPTAAGEICCGSPTQPLSLQRIFEEALVEISPEDVDKVTT